MTAEMQSLLDAYDDALHSFHQLAATVHDDQWTLPTDCPGWTVREQVAHVVAAAGVMAAAAAPAAR